MMIDVLSYWVM